MATKRKREPIKAPSEEEWNAHKYVLCKLRFESTLPELMKRMENEHKFIASKNQYERKLKEEWGFRKNLTRDEWDYIMRKMHERAISGKESQIMLHRFLIPKGRIKKEEGRYIWSELNRIFSSYPNAPSPEGICVSTPLSTVLGDIIKEIQIDNLPSFVLRDFLTPQGGSNPFYVHQTKPPESVWPTAVISTPRMFDVEEDIVSSEYTTGDVATSTQRASVSRELISVMASWTGITLAGYSNPIRIIHSRLRAILPEQLHREFLGSTEDLPGLMKLDENAQYLSLAMYLISNNMLQNMDCGKVIGYFEHQRGRHLLNSLLSMKGLPAVDAFAEKLLVTAATVANTMIIKELLKAGLDPNTRDGYSYKQPLQYAVGRSNNELVQVLLAAGADVNTAAHSNGRTALQAAAEQGDIELVQVLLAAGAAVNSPPARWAGATALQVSAIKGYVGIAIVLLDAGAEVNAQAAANHGRTALEGAAEHGRIDMVQLLLNAGVKLSGSGDAQYRKALELALNNGHNTVKQLIENRYESGGND